MKKSIEKTFRIAWYLFGCSMFFITLNIHAQQNTKYTEINRLELVNRHNISHSEITPLNSLTVGNGEFAYTVDITGMQSFPSFYEKGISLGTQSQWGWHSFPNPENYTLEDVYKKYSTGKDSVVYAYQYTYSKDERKNRASQWLRENPNRLHLGLIGLEIYDEKGKKYAITDISSPVQKLNLWKGEIRSTFEIDGTPVEVITYCHQDMDMVSFHITSDLLSSGRLKMKVTFPYATHEKFSTSYDLSHPEAHHTEITDSSSRFVVFKRQVDNSKYYARLCWKGNAQIQKKSEHEYFLATTGENNILEACCYFSKDIPVNVLPGFSETAKNNEIMWEKFWNSGGAVDFSKCTDTRAFELERRVVLSQYLTKIQCSGSLPPQETGLTYNSWHGKFHMEMLWWHAVHFILWNRAELTEQELNYYFKILDQAKHTAHIQHYDGARWPKMTGPDGRESPSTINPFLIWQQPHIIYFAELLYQSGDQDGRILNKYKDLIFATADFMASFARWDSVNNRYFLGPPLIPAQERFKAETTVNPTFELAYWYWGLQTAQKWRERLGMKKNESWQQVIDHLSDLPVKDSLYLFTENATDSYTNPVYLTDHPAVLGIMGFLPETDKVNTKIMDNTLDTIIKLWHWKTVWGWDMPLAAMNAVCLDKPGLAVDLLMKDTPKNTWLMNGHNYQDEVLTIYLPGNGGLLTAVSMMCTYRDENGKNGFPDDGKWNVQYENLQKMY